MPSVTYVPHFSIRWTEPDGALTKMQHVVDVDVNEHAGKMPSTGRITTTSSAELGRIPAGDKFSEMRIINDEQSRTMATDLWKAVQSSNVRQWLQPSDTSARLGRSEMELTIHRPGGAQEIFRADLHAPAQPIADVIAAAGKVIGDLRIGPRLRS